MDLTLDSGNLCVVTSNPEVNAEWFLPKVLDSGSLVGFARKLPPFPAGRLLDLSENIFSQNFKLSDIVTKTSGEKFVGLIYPDILIQAGKLSADDILELVNELLGRGQAVAIICSISNALLNEDYITGQQQNRLVVSLLHKCHVSVSVRPFKTGRANDATGIVVIGPGPRGIERNTTDYVYTVKNTGKVEVVPRAST